MAASTLRKAIGTLKDQTTISIAKLATSNISTKLEIAIVKATSHDEDVPPSEKHIQEIVETTSRNSLNRVRACVASISKRLGKTRDWIVALKALILIHRLLNEGNQFFHEELYYATWKGSRIINMCEFKDEAHSYSWNQSAFVSNYSMYLDQKLSLLILERKRSNESFSSKDSGRLFSKLVELQKLMDRFIACRQKGLARDSRIVVTAAYLVVKDSFRIYTEIREVLSDLLVKIFDMERQDCIKAFDLYVTTAKQVDELIGCYNWWKEKGVGRSSEYPNVERVSGDVLANLEEFVRGKVKRSEKKEAAAIVADKNEIKALPLPLETEPKAELREAENIGDLIDLSEDSTEIIPADNQGDVLALALFADSNVEQAKSEWHTPVSEVGEADWELALIETARSFAKQEACMPDRDNPRESSTPILALPAPDDPIQGVSQDPYGVATSIVPATYTQMAYMKQKQHSIDQEKEVWQQYANYATPYQGSLGNVGGSGCITMPMVPYTMPRAYTMNSQTGNHYAPY